MRDLMKRAAGVESGGGREQTVIALGRKRVSAFPVLILHSRTTARPIFLPSVPLMKPRTECACQLVASMIAFSVVPPGCFMRARIGFGLAALASTLGLGAFGRLRCPVGLGLRRSFLSATLGVCGATGVAEGGLRSLQATTVSGCSPRL